MSDLDEAVQEFLGLGRIAVVGVSRSADQPANLIYRKLRDTGRQVFPVNPRAQAVEGDVCYPDVGSIPGGVEGAVIVTAPEAAASVVDDCAAAGIGHVWLHRSFGSGSVSPEAVERGRRAGLAVIPGACPMMYCEPVDVGHRCMRFVARITGQLPHPPAARPPSSPPPGAPVG